MVLPQIVASAINISYNTTQIVGQLTEPQQQMFMQLVTIYNVADVSQSRSRCSPGRSSRCGETWREMHAATPLAAGRVAAARKQALRLPLWVAGLTCVPAGCRAASSFRR